MSLAKRAAAHQNAPHMLRPKLATLLFAAYAVQAEPQAPPPAIIITGSPEVQPAAQIQRAGVGTTLYSIGEPTDEEQLYLELVNRTRADALTEALRLANTTDPDIRSAYQFFKVDLQKFVNDTAGYPVAQPLAFESRLITAARGHSTWMLTHGIQSHDQTDPPGSANVVADLGDRLNAVGYPFTNAGESIYAFASSPEQGHAGFEVDWGNGPGGMQNPPGHRNSNHNPAFREVGIGVLNGSGPNNTGPQVVTIDFGNRSFAPMVTGVAYYDLNGNNFYDLGEGVGGVTVDVSASTFHAVSSQSGGFAVPTANGARTVTFSGAGLSPTNVSVTISGGLNSKADLRLAYVAPVPAGSANPAVGAPNRYTFAAVPGATGYIWQSATLSAWPAGTVEGAEQGTVNFATELSPGYTATTTKTKRTGTTGFQLAHPTTIDQFLTLNHRLRPRTGGALTFWKRIGFATPTQVAQVEVSEDDGGSWTSVWSQAGNGATSSLNIEQSFTQQSVSLTAFVGKIIRVRFAFHYNGGTFFPGAEDLKGFFFDDIAFGNTDLLANITANPIPAEPAFDFAPPGTGTYLLSVQPKLGTRTLPAGASLTVSATVQAVLTVGRVAISPAAAGKVNLVVTVTGGTPASVRLERSPTPSGPYELTGDSATVSGGGTYTFSAVDTMAAGGFFRIRAQ